jgi:hypothetical protein
MEMKEEESMDDNSKIFQLTTQLDYALMEDLQLPNICLCTIFCLAVISD